MTRCLTCQKDSSAIIIFFPCFLYCSPVYPQFFPIHDKKLVLFFMMSAPFAFSSSYRFPTLKGELLQASTPHSHHGIAYLEILADKPSSTMYLPPSFSPPPHTQPALYPPFSNPTPWPPIFQKGSLPVANRSTPPIGRNCANLTSPLSVLPPSRSAFVCQWRCLSFSRNPTSAHS